MTPSLIDLPLSPTETLDEDTLRRLTQEYPGFRMRLPGVLTPDEYRQMQALRKAQYVLMRNNGAASGERWPCGNPRHRSEGLNAVRGYVFEAPVYHTHLTIQCIARPYNGRDGFDKGLRKIVQLSSSPEMRKRLSPYIPDLADTDPRTAAMLRPRERGEDFYLYTIAFAEPIEGRDGGRAEAQHLADQITRATGRQYRI